MNVRIFPAGHIQTNAFLLSDPDRKEAILIDAPHDVVEVVEQALKEDGCELKALLLTHGHWDHTGDAAKIQRMGVPVYGHEADRPMFEEPEMMKAFLGMEIELEPVALENVVADGDELEFLGRKVEVLHVPGHCPGNVTFLFPDEKLAFVGDALFAGSIGRTDFPNCSFEELQESIQTKLYPLDDGVVVLPGHGPNTTIGQEKASNPYVRPL